jgi:hypothetical protein
VLIKDPNEGYISVQSARDRRQCHEQGQVWASTLVDQAAQFIVAEMMRSSLIVLGGILLARGLFQPLSSISARTYVFLALSGVATGASWICYFRALQLGDAPRVAPVDKLNLLKDCGQNAAQCCKNLIFHNGLLDDSRCFCERL